MTYGSAGGSPIAVAALADLDSLIDYLHDMQAVRPDGGIERRAEERYPLAVVVDYVPLDQSQRPCGPAENAVTRDLSRSGIGLFTERAISAEFLRVRIRAWAGRRAELLVEVLRCAPLDFVYDVGGRILQWQWSGE